MKVLFLCNKSPYPPREGGPLAINANILSLIKAGHQEKVLAMNTNKYFIEPKDIPADYFAKTNIELVYNDLSVKPVQAFLNLFSSKSFHVERFISREFSEKIVEILQGDNFDIVQLEMLYMTPYIDIVRKFSNAKIVLRSHNIEHLIWDRVASTTSNPLKRIYLKYLTRKLKNYELGHLNSYDGIIPISKKDAEFFKDNGCTIPVTEVPFGVEINDYKAGKPDYEPFSLFHIGSMNWMPNEEGIHWFVHKAWPLIHSNHPNVKLYLAGREMPEWLKNLRLSNVEVVGEVPDASEFIHSKAVMIVPLFSGSGIRIKIIEGMALGKTIISTSIGAEGINYSDSKNILIANDPPEFLQAIDKCFSNEDYCTSLGKNARKFIREEHSLDNVVQKLESFYKSIL